MSEENPTLGGIHEAKKTTQGTWAKDARPQDPTKLQRGPGLTLQGSPLSLKPGDSGISLGNREIVGNHVMTPEEKLAEMERIAEEELTELQKNFREAARREAEGYMLEMDTEFWIALAFQTQAAKLEFLAKTGLDALGDKYLCGEAAAAIVGVEMTTPIPDALDKKQQSSRRLKALATDHTKTDLTAVQPLHIPGAVEE